jgi:hypothetical protein
MARFHPAQRATLFTGLNVYMMRIAIIDEKAHSSGTFNRYSSRTTP